MLNVPDGTTELHDGNLRLKLISFVVKHIHGQLAQAEALEETSGSSRHEDEADQVYLHHFHCDSRCCFDPSCELKVCQGHTGNFTFISVQFLTKQADLFE